MLDKALGKSRGREMTLLTFSVFGRWLAVTRIRIGVKSSGIFYFCGMAGKEKEK